MPVDDGNRAWTIILISIPTWIVYFLFDAQIITCYRIIGLITGSSDLFDNSAGLTSTPGLNSLDDCEVMKKRRFLKRETKVDNEVQQKIRNSSESQRLT